MLNMNVQTQHEPQRDQYFDRLSTTVQEATLEPLSLLVRLRMERIYNQRAMQQGLPFYPMTELYKRVRCMVWNVDTVQALIEHRRHSDRQWFETFAPDMPEHYFPSWLYERVKMDFDKLCKRIAPTMERFVIENLPHLPTMENSVPLRQWAPMFKMLREFVLIVDDIKPNAQLQHNRASAFRYDPLLQMLRFPDRLFKYCKKSLQKVVVNLEKCDNLEQYGMPYDGLFHFVRTLYATVEEVYQNPWIQLVADVQRWPRFKRLHTYRLFIFDTTLLSDDERELEMSTIPLLNRWIECTNARFASPPQIRKLTIVWTGRLCAQSFRMFLEQLTLFTELLQLNLTLSLKQWSRNWPIPERTAQEWTRLFNEFIPSTVVDHQWPYRALSLVFFNEQQHEKIDPNGLLPEEETLERHAPQCSWLHRLFTSAANAQMLRYLSLTLHDKLVPFNVTATGIESLTLNFRYWTTFPNVPDERYFYRPANYMDSGKIFDQFPYSHNVYELILLNISHPEHLEEEDFFPEIPTTPEEVKQTQSNFIQFFNHLSFLFPNLIRLSICSNECKVSTLEITENDGVGHGGWMQMDTRVNERTMMDTFYLRHHRVVQYYVRFLMKRMEKNFDETEEINIAAVSDTTTDSITSTTTSATAVSMPVFRELHLCDQHAKPYDFVQMLVQRFMRQAKKYPTQHFLLHIEPCDIVEVENLSGADDVADVALEEGIERNRLQTIQRDYERMLAAANEIRNLRLILPELCVIKSVRI